MHNLTTGQSLSRRLHDLGLLPPHCRRVTIDATVGDAVRVLYECYLDEATAEAVAGWLVERSCSPEQLH